MRKKSLTSRKLAKILAAVASDVKALDIVVLDMRKVVNFCDFFVICSGNTERQVVAIAQRMEEELAKQGISAKYKSGPGVKDWVVFDAGDVVAHIFDKNTREFYSLEYLWAEAKEIAWEDKK